MMTKLVEIYTDGACSGNPGPGGWGTVLIYQNTVKELSGGEAWTTNNRMELMAATSGLNALKEPCRVRLYSDSAYLVNAFTQGWITKWQMNGWRTAKKEPVENQELWYKLLDLSDVHHISWHKVKGHDGDAYNDLCDAMAVEEAAKYHKAAKTAPIS